MLNEVIETVTVAVSAIQTATNATKTTSVVRDVIKAHPIASVVSAAVGAGAASGVTTHVVTVNEFNKERHESQKKNFFKPERKRAKATDKKEDDTVFTDTSDNKESNETVSADKDDNMNSQTIDKESTEVTDTGIEKVSIDEAKLPEKILLNEQFSSALQKISSENVDICQISATSFDISRYKKFDSKELSELIGINLKAASSVASSVSNAVSVGKANEIMSDGVFKVVFKKGVTDKSIKDLCKNCEDLLITTYRDERGFNQAGLLRVDGDISNQLKNITAANVVNSTMSVLSAVVGSYYLHNIDKSLKDIEEKIDKLTEMSHDEKYALLKAIYESLVEISHKFYSGYLNKEQIASYQNLVVQNRQECGRIVIYYEEQLDKLTERLDADCKDRTVFENTIKDFNLYMRYYQLAVEVYTIAYNFEIIISENRNDSFLKDSISNIREFVKGCNNKQNLWHEKIDSYIRNVSALDFQWWKEIFSTDEIYYKQWKEHWTKESGEWVNGFGNYSEYTRKDLEKDLIKNTIKFDISPLNKNIESLVKYADQEVNLVSYRGELYYIDKNQLNDLETEEN
ncbi:MAG: hypothetical protein K2J11_07560 [Oscillospiraceae bacterium]|nr:hypothetical protein [Oscillospiraceae bacterium]